MGSRDRAAARQRDRLAGPAHGAACATRCAPPATRRLIAAQDRARASTPISPARSSSGCSTTSPARATARERGELAFGTIDSWLVWNLTRGAAHVTDASNASRTLLFDIHRGDWDDELLALLDVPREVLPRVVAVVGRLRRDASSTACDVPIAGIAGDQQAALFGQACHAPGLAKNTYGTGCFLLLNTGAKAVASQQQPGDDGRVASAAAAIDYALEGSVFIGGAVVQWLRDGLQIIRTAADVEALAASVPDNGGVYFVPAFAGLGAPHWDAVCARRDLRPDARRDRGHISRARRWNRSRSRAPTCSTRCRRMPGSTLTELRVDGGATANDLLMQIQADVLGVPVVRPQVLETTALGAAYLAGLAVGYWKSDDDIARNWRVDRRFEPTGAAAAPARERWHEAVARAKRWAQSD